MFYINYDEFKNYQFDSNNKIDFNNIDLLEFIYKSGGYQKPIDKQKSTKNAIVLRDSFDNKILLYPKTNTYKNLDYPGDKGGIFNFVINRIDNELTLGFKTSSHKRKALIILSKFLNHIKSSNINSSVDNSKSKIEESKNQNSKSIIFRPLKKFDFLKNRKISNKIIFAPIFKDRIYNGYLKDNSKNIVYNYPNIAFPLFDKDNKIKGAILRNKNFKSFFGDYHQIWYSNINKIDSIKNINIFESEIDALSHYQLNYKQFPNSLYISTGGNLYKEKLNSIYNIISKFFYNKDVKFNFCFDNDIAGSKFDFKLLNLFLKEQKINLDIQFLEYKNLNNIKLNFNFLADVPDELVNFFDSKFSNHPAIKFEYKTVHKFHINLIYNHKDSLNILNNIFLFSSDFFLKNNFSLNLHKSKNKDWNEDLLVIPKKKIRF